MGNGGGGCVIIDYDTVVIMFTQNIYTQEQEERDEG